MRTDSPNMSSASSPKIPPRDTASPAADATGYLLLTIPHTTVKQIYDGSSMTLAKGELKLECVTMPIPKEIGHQTANPFSPSPADPAVPTHDFWLVLQVGTFEMPVVPGQQLIPTPEPTPEGIVYTVPSPSVPNAFLSITVPRPASAADMEDLDSFETLLRQYKSLGVEATALANVTVPPIGSAARNNRYDQEGDEDYRGKLVLINEDSGEVIGQLDQELSVEDGQRLAKDDQNRPVILDFGHVIDGYAPSVKVQRVPEAEMDDWMLKSAHHLSRGILSVGSFTSKMMQSGASLYIKHATPNAEPTKLSPMAKANIRRVHNGSVRTVNVTKTTVGMINNAIMNVLDKTVGARVIEPAVRTYDDFSSSRKASMSSEGEKGGFWPPSPGGLGRKPPPPPVPPKTGKAASLVVGNQGQPPSSTSPITPGRAPSPLKVDTTSAVTGDVRQPDNETWFEKGEMEHLLGQPPAYTSEPQQTSASPSGQSTPSSAQKAKRPWLGRLVLAGEVVLTSLEHTAHELINSGTSAASSAAGHKFGAEVGHATALLGGSVRNVAVVYIDVRGVGRRALLKSTAKGFVKARLKNGGEIRLQGEGRDVNGVEVDIGEIEQGDKGQIVVGMPEVRKKEDVNAPRAGQRSVTASGYPVDKKLE